MKPSIWKKELGDAISYEDVMSLMTVIFVLFFIIVIPLINLERNRIEKAKIDPFWLAQVEELLSRENQSPEGKRYSTAFALEDFAIHLNSQPPLRTIEAVRPDSTLKIILHNTQEKTFTSMHINASSGIVVYQKGWIHWSETDGEWFKEIQDIDYGSKEFSHKLQQHYRDWVDFKE